jgi:hypothetical protein
MSTQSSLTHPIPPKLYSQSAIACCGRVSAIALQKTLKIKRSLGEEANAVKFLTVFANGHKFIRVFTDTEFLSRSYITDNNEVVLLLPSSLPP